MLTLFLVGVLLLIAAIIVPLLLMRSKQGLRTAYAVLAGVALLLFAFVLGFRSMLLEVEPGKIARVYSVGGAQRDLMPGYNRVAPWDRVYVLDATVQYFEFYQLDYVSGVETGASDVFGAQSKDADYIYALAKISVRVDPERVDEYIDRYGPSGIGIKLEGTLKDELKASLDEAFKDYGTEDLMTQKAEVAEKAIAIAKQRLAGFPILVEHLEFPDFDAGENYEENIRAKADIRMRTEQATLTEQLNARTAQANKAEADGAATVALVKAQNDADIELVKAQNEAAIREVEAQNAATVASIKAENDAQVKQVQADADAKVVEVSAAAEATANLALAEAEAKSAALVGAAYQEHPALLQLEQIKVQQALAEGWNGLYLPSIGGGEGSSLNFLNLTDIAQRILGEGFESLNAGTEADGQEQVLWPQQGK